MPLQLVFPAIYISEEILFFVEQIKNISEITIISYSL